MRQDLPGAARGRAAAHARHAGTDAGARTSDNGRVGAEHADAGAELGATKRNHVLPDVGSDDLAVLVGSVGQDVLDQIVAILVAGDVDERDAGTIVATLADTIEVATQELRAADLEALLDNLGCELISAILGGIANDVVDGAATVGRGTVLADVLDAPVAELAMGNDVDVGKDLLDAGALLSLVTSITQV